MNGLMKRAETLARRAARRKAREAAAYLQGLLRGATVDVEDMRVVVTGRSLLKRWLGDARLRFIGGHLQ